MGYIRMGHFCLILHMLTTLPVMAAVQQPSQDSIEIVAPSGEINGETPENEGGSSPFTIDRFRIDSLLQKGRMALVHKEYDAALDSFMEAYLLDHQDKNIIHSVMAVHIRKGNYSDAVSFLEQAANVLESPSDRQEIHEIIAVVYYKKAQKDDKDGKAAEAEVSLRKAVSLDPDSAQYLIALARMRHKYGSFADAEKLLGEGLERFKDEPSRQDIRGALDKMRMNETILRKIR